MCSIKKKKKKKFRQNLLFHGLNLTPELCQPKKEHLAVAWYVLSLWCTNITNFYFTILLCDPCDGSFWSSQCRSRKLGSSRKFLIVPSFHRPDFSSFCFRLQDLCFLCCCYLLLYCYILYSILYVQLSQGWFFICRAP